MSDDKEFYYCSKGCINWTHFWFHQQVSTKQSFINCQNSSNSLVFPKRFLFGFTYIWWYGSAPKAPLFHLPTWKAQSRKSTSFCPSTESRRTRSNNHWRLDWRISSANLKWLVLSNNKPKFQYTKQKGVFAFKITFTTFFFSQVTFVSSSSQSVIASILIQVRETRTSLAVELVCEHILSLPQTDSTFAILLATAWE